MESRASEEVLRFLYLRSFDPGLAVRVEKTGPHVKLTAVELEGGPTLEPGSVAQRVMRELKPAEWESLQEVLEDAGFWNLPTNKRIPGALDGSHWVVEVFKDGEHHVVDRWSGDEMEAVGLRFLELSGLDPGDIY